MFEILSKEQLEYMTLFDKYLSLWACPSDFAIGSGALPFANNKNALCSNYYIDDTNELYYSKIMISDIEGDYNYINKRDRFYSGIRLGAFIYNIDEKLIIDKMQVNEDISVIEYGYFPNKLIKEKVKKESTSITIKLPVSKGSLNPVEYKEFPVYKDKDLYYIEYPVNGLITEISNKTYYEGMVARFSIEPVRFWVDNKSGLMISQDVVLGGVPYLFLYNIDEYTIDDYNRSDALGALQIIEEDMNILSKLLNPEENKKVIK